MIETDAITLEEYLALPDDGYRYEVSRGRLVREPQPSDKHGEVTATIAFVLSSYLDKNPIGRLRIASGFLLSREPLIIRGPDIAFVSHERLRDSSAEPFFEGAPDLAVEIVSPSNTAEDLQEKVADYFEAGAKVVWVVYPRTRSVVVHAVNGEIRERSSTEMLSVPSVLPEFEVAVAKLFL